MHPDFFPVVLTIEYTGSDTPVRALPGWKVAERNGVSILTSPEATIDDLSSIEAMVALLKGSGATFSEPCLLTASVNVGDHPMRDKGSAVRLASYMGEWGGYICDLGGTRVRKAGFQAESSGWVHIRAWRPTFRMDEIESALRFVGRFACAVLGQGIPASPRAYAGESVLARLVEELGLSGCAWPERDASLYKETKEEKLKRKRSGNPRLDSLLKARNRLAKIEPHSMRYCRPFDAENLDPVLLYCGSKKLVDVWNYWRAALYRGDKPFRFEKVSEDFRPFMVVDKTSGAVLGLFAVEPIPAWVVDNRELIEWRPGMQDVVNPAHVASITKLVALEAFEAIEGMAMLWDLVVTSDVARLWDMLTPYALTGFLTMAESGAFPGKGEHVANFNGQSFVFVKYRENALDFLRGDVRIEKLGGKLLRSAWEVMEAYRDTWEGEVSFDPDKYRLDLLIQREEGKA